jgi:ComEC/Rec2-related protein
MAIRYARLHSALRMQAPLLGIALTLLAGQSLYYVLIFQWSLGTMLLSAVLAVVLVFQVIIRRGLKPRLIRSVLVMIGFASAWLATPRTDSIFDHAAQFSTDKSYLARVIEEPRFRSPGRIEVVLTIYGEMQRQPEGGFTLKRHPPRKILCRGVDLPWKNLTSTLPNALLIMRGTFRPLIASDTVLESFAGTLLRSGFDATCRIRYATIATTPPLSLLAKLRNAVRSLAEQALGIGEPSGLFLAMTLGSRDLISSDTENAFKRTGLAHLLVASGAQVTLVYYFYLQLLEALLVKIPRVALLVCIPHVARAAALIMSFFFVCIIGAESACMRAALALFFLVIASLSERSGGMAGGILFSLLILALLWPGSYLDPGVQLSYSALIGLWIGALLIDSKLGRAITCSLCASIATSFVGLLWFGTISVVGLLLNIVVAPLTSFLCCNMGLLGIAIASIGLDSHAYLIRAVGEILLRFRALVYWFADQSWAATTFTDTQKLVPGIILWGAFALLSGIAVLRATQRDPYLRRITGQEYEDPQEGSGIAGALAGEAATAVAAASSPTRTAEASIACGVISSARRPSISN